MRDLNLYLKHSFSCLADQTFRVLIDDEKKIVTIVSKVFDSSLIDCLVSTILPDDHGVTAFRDDDEAWTPEPAPYRLRIRIGGDDGQEFAAEAVRLASAISSRRALAITLAPAVRPERDVTDLKGMFGKTGKVVSIEEMNAAIAARGSSDKG